MLGEFYGAPVVALMEVSRADKISSYGVGVDELVAHHGGGESPVLRPQYGEKPKAGDAPSNLAIIDIVALTFRFRPRSMRSNPVAAARFS